MGGLLGSPGRGGGLCSAVAPRPHLAGTASPPLHRPSFFAHTEFSREEEEMTLSLQFFLRGPLQHGISHPRASLASPSLPCRLGPELVGYREGRLCSHTCPRCVAARPSSSSCLGGPGPVRELGVMCGRAPSPADSEPGPSSETRDRERASRPDPALQGGSDPREATGG